MPEHFLKIIYYSPHPTHDIVSEVGYSTHQRETINAMRALGHDVRLVIMGGTERSEVEIYHKQITTEGGFKKILKKTIPRIIINTLKDIALIRHDKKAAAALKQAIVEFKPDLVYERNEYMQDKGTLLARKMHVKHFLEINSPCVGEMRVFEGPSLLHNFGISKEKKKVRNTDRIFVVSSALKSFIQEHYKPTAPMEIIPNCIDPEKELPDQAKVQDIKQSLGLEGKKVIGFVGSIFEHHGVDKLIKAFSIVRKKYENAVLLIVGDGILRADYERLANGILPKGSFYFTGKVPHKNVMNYIELFDIAVMPDSNWYGSPIKIFEYGLLKKPIVAPDYGPLQDVMENGKDGILSKTDPNSLAEALVKVLEMEEKAQVLGTHFHQKIMDNFTWKKQTEKILSGTFGQS